MCILPHHLNIRHIFYRVISRQQDTKIVVSTITSTLLNFKYISSYFVFKVGLLISYKVCMIVPARFSMIRMKNIDHKLSSNKTSKDVCLKLLQDPNIIFSFFRSYTFCTCQLVIYCLIIVKKFHTFLETLMVQGKNKDI